MAKQTVGITKQDDIQSGGHAASRSRTLESPRPVWTCGPVRVPLVSRTALWAEPQGREPTCGAFTPGRGPSNCWRWGVASSDLGFRKISLEAMEGEEGGAQVGASCRGLSNTRPGLRGGGRKASWGQKQETLQRHNGRPRAGADGL